MSSSHRQYDVVLFGATGYTGKLTAEYIATNLPTDLKWAIAGRSVAKLEAVAATCKSLDPDRIQPVVEICRLDDAELGDLARKTTILITTVGPYALYGEHAFKACAENGTHYLDVTGECPWVRRMIQKYEKSAKTTGAIMIAEIGMGSAPADMVTWSLVSLIRRELSAPTKEVICCVHELRASASGGTIASALNIVESYSIAEMRDTRRPFALSPIPGPNNSGSATLLNKILGVRIVPVLGTLTTSIGATISVPIVQRSWGLLGDAKVYGPKFNYSEYMRTRNVYSGLLLHFGFLLGTFLIALSPIRWLARKFVFQPGEGPTVEDSKTNRVEYRAVAYPDLESNTKTAYCRAKYEGGMYSFSALLLGEATMVLLKDDVVAKKFGGGILTPATLGQPFVDRLHKAGFTIETKMLD